MKIWITKLISFLTFVFAGKLLKPPVVENEEVPSAQPTINPPEPAPAVAPQITDDPYTSGRNLASRIFNYMRMMGYFVDTSSENGNIVYVSGVRKMFNHKEDIDDWDDLRVIVKFDKLGPYIDFLQAASTEPGEISRKSSSARKLGGVATVVPGQYKSWKMGFHKHDIAHPALVQCADLTIWRDTNANATFDNEMMFEGMFGINQHSTKPGFTGPKVGAWSAGCLVGKDFEQHLVFIDKLKSWAIYKENEDCLFVTTIIPMKSLFGENENKDNA